MIVTIDNNAVLFEAENDADRFAVGRLTEIFAHQVVGENFCVQGSEDGLNLYIE